MQDSGIVNSALIGAGLTNQPVHLMYNAFGTVVGMGQILLPYAIITMYGVMVGIKPRLLQTAQVLGASPMRAFLDGVLPAQPARPVGGGAAGLHHGPWLLRSPRR